MPSLDEMDRDLEQGDVGLPAYSALAGGSSSGDDDEKHQAADDSPQQRQQQQHQQQQPQRQEHKQNPTLSNSSGAASSVVVNVNTNASQGGNGNNEAEDEAPRENSVSISRLSELERARRAFDTFDTDRSGTLDREEFRKLVSFPDLQSDQRHFLSDREVDAMVARIDSSHDGLISFEEFAAWWMDERAGAGSNDSGGDAEVSFQAKRIHENMRQRSFFDNLRNFGVRPTYFCHICRAYELSGTSDSYRLSTCGHEYCRECLAGYLENRIGEGQVYLSCFHGDSNTKAPCGAAIKEPDVEAVAAQATLTKYQRFKLQKEVKEIRECSACGHMQPGDPRHPAMICKECAHAYCFVHGDAHPESTCARYEQLHMAENAKNQAALEGSAKPCPRCQAMTVRSGGCMHMRCAICNGSWCWLCSQEIEDSPTPSHYTYDPANPNNPCAGKQFVNGSFWDSMLSDTRGWRRAVCAVATVLILGSFGLLIFPTALAFFALFAVVWLLCFGLSFGNACRVFDDRDRLCCVGLFQLSAAVAGALWMVLCCIPMGLVYWVLKCGGCWRVGHMGVTGDADAEAAAAAGLQFRREMALREQQEREERRRIAEGREEEEEQEELDPVRAEEEALARRLALHGRVMETDPELRRLQALEEGETH